MVARTFKRHFESACRKGQVLVEFPIVAFVSLLILTGILVLGFGLYSAQIVQQVADAGSMELARLPLPPEIQFPNLGTSPYSSTSPVPEAGNLFADDAFKTQIFDEQFLVIDLEQVSDLNAFFADLPVINQLLRPLMVVDRTILEGTSRQLLRYPGAIVRNTGRNDSNNGGLTVLIPIVTSRSEAGNEVSLEWRAVIEEVRDSAGVGHFSLSGSSQGIGPGMVSLRVNYPFQSAAAIAFQYRRRSDGSVTGNVEEVLGSDVDNIPVLATDPALTPPAPYELVADPVDPTGQSSAHSGQLGLGQLQALGTQVRPYRKVLTGHAIYRRESYR